MLHTKDVAKLKGQAKKKTPGKHASSKEEFSENFYPEREISSFSDLKVCLSVDEKPIREEKSAFVKIKKILTYVLKLVATDQHRF